MQALITGGTGLIGSRLSQLLRDKNYAISILTRDKTDLTGEIKKYHWDIDKAEVDDDAIRNADFIINLAGTPVAPGRWTAKRKEDIYHSRVAGTMLLVQKLQALNHPLKAFLNVSASGYFGDRGDKWLTEDDPAGKDFLARVCSDWEAQAQKVAALGIRTVIGRLGVVLSRDGGALPELEKPMSFGVAAYLGTGAQYYSWVHLDDVCGAFIYALENEMMSGGYHVVGNNPVKNKDLIAAIKKAKGAHAITVPVPAFALKMVLGEMSQSVLYSQRLINEKLLSTGFELKYPALQEALANLYS